MAGFTLSSSASFLKMKTFLMATPMEGVADLVGQAEAVFTLVAALVIAMVAFYLVLRVVKGIGTDGYESGGDSIESMDDDEYQDWLIENDLEDPDREDRGY